jgi:hypothetical protein
MRRENFDLFRSKHTILLFTVLSIFMVQGQTNQVYTYKKGDPNGTGKWYMDREIAYVMGYQGMAWLERQEREAEENTTTLIDNMGYTAYGCDRRHWSRFRLSCV